jgi:hypothetical protein
MGEESFCSRALTVWICQVRSINQILSVAAEAKILNSQIFPAQSAESLHAAVRKHLLTELHGLDPSAVMEVRRLLHAAIKDQNDPDAILMRETYGRISVLIVFF